MFIVIQQDSALKTYMKFSILAPPIGFFCCFLLLAGCESLGLPDITRHDEVPLEAKAEPRLVTVPLPAAADQPPPPLGGVPGKPKDFSPKPVYDHYMNELEFDRAEAETRKKTLEGNDTTMTLQPPQFPKE
jgi:hypothetical protein